MKSKWQLILLAIFLGAGLGLGACLRRSCWRECYGRGSGQQAHQPTCTCCLLSRLPCTCGLLCADTERLDIVFSAPSCGPCTVRVFSVWARWGGRTGARTVMSWCVCVWEVAGRGEGAWARGGLCTSPALCPGRASPHRFQAARVSSQHSDVFSGRSRRQVAPQAGSSEEPLMLLIQLKLKNNVEWKMFQKKK